MKKLRLICGFVLLCTGFVCIAADPAEGFWLSTNTKTGAVESGWEFYQVDGILYGKMLSALGQTSAVLAVKCKVSYRDFPVAGRVNQMPMLGTPWMFGLRLKQTGEWVDGYVINPEDGNMFKLKVTYHPADGKKFMVDALEVRGEIGLGIGMSQYWRKASREQASTIR